MKYKIKPYIKVVKNVKYLNTSEEKIVSDIFAMSSNEFSADNLSNKLNGLVKKSTQYNNLTFNIKELINSGYNGGEFSIGNDTIVILDDASFFNNLMFKKAIFSLSFLHEFRHANQEVLKETKRDNELFKAMKEENYQEKVLPKYEYSLHELDARFYSIKQFYALMKKNEIPNCLETYFMLSRECFTLLTNLSGVLNSQAMLCSSKVNPSSSIYAVKVLEYLNAVNPQHNINIYKLERAFSAIISIVSKIYKFAFNNLEKSILSNKEFMEYYKNLNIGERIKNADICISNMSQFCVMMEQFAFNKKHYLNNYLDCLHLPSLKEQEIKLGN